MPRLTGTLRTAALLARHDLRIGFRRVFARFGRASTLKALAISGGALFVFHLLAWPVAGWLAAAQAEPGDGAVYPAVAAGALFVMPWLTSQAINATARTLYAQADLELVLSAPIPSSAVLAARCLAISVEAAVSVGIFLAPIADVAAIRAGRRWLALYPMLAAASLIATSVGATIAFVLFWRLGPRRTRFFAQLTAATIGAGFVLSIQAAAFLPARMRLFAVVDRLRSGSSAHAGLIWLPVRAAMGEPGALGIWCLAAAAAFIATIAFLGPVFAAFAARAAGNASGQSNPAARLGRPFAFAAGKGKVLRSKEWRLLRRDPWLISQILLQVVYALPIGVLILRSPGLHGSVALAAAPTIVVVACQVSASFAWLVISSEEAPDLLLSAPLSRRAVEIRKLQAIAPPLACLICPPLIALASTQPASAVLTLCFAACAAGSSALLNFWHPAPGRRNEILRRHAQSKLVGLMEHLLSLAWAIAVCLALLGSVAAVAPIFLAALVLYFNRPRRSLVRA